MNDDEKNITYLSKIYYLIKSEFRENYDDLNKIFFTLSILGIVSLFFSGKEDDGSYQYVWYLISMVIMFVLVVFNAIKALNPLEQFLSIPLTKFLLSVFFASTLMYSTAEVSIKLNQIFFISGTYFKYSLFFGTIIYFVSHLLVYLSYIVPLILVVVTWKYVEDIYEGNNFRGILNRYCWNLKFNKNLFYLIVFSFFFLGVLHLKDVALNRVSIDYKLFIIAENFDFDSKHRCKNLDRNLSIIYLDSSKEKILVNHFKSDNNTFKRFFRNDSNNVKYFNKNVNDKSNFEVKFCEY